MMQYFGGLPYIDTVLSATEKMSLPRLSYQECADKAAVDFRMAADLLPINWDNTTVGKQTAGKNDLRINKIMALGYLGKNYLWAASPLMEHGAQLGGSNTYNYNTEYAKKAAEAFGELLTLVESGQTQYALAQFDYSDIYNHTNRHLLLIVILKYSILLVRTGKCRVLQKLFSVVRPKTSTVVTGI